MEEKPAISSFSSHLAQPESHLKVTSSASGCESSLLVIGALVSFPPDLCLRRRKVARETDGRVRFWVNEMRTSPINATCAPPWFPLSFSSSHIHLFQLDPSHMLSHAGGSLGRREPSPVAVLHAIIIPSAAGVFPDCALGLSLQGAYGGAGSVEGSRGWGGCLSHREWCVWCVWQWLTYSCPEQSKAGLVSSA